MLSEKMERALVEQLNKELYSEYLYLSIEAYFANLNFDGFAHWMNIQAKEERAHARGFFDYIIERKGKVELLAIEKPQNNWESPLEAFKAVLAHEQFVTQSINNLAEIACQEKDRAAGIFLNWYIKEQVEEESSVENILSKIERINCDECALLSLDKELASREFVEPEIN